MDFDPDQDADPVKNRKNVAKHGLDFYGAATVFRDPLAVDIPDPAHSENEERYLVICETEKGHLIVVYYTERDGRSRIIGTRKPTRSERKEYEDGKRG